MKIQIFFFTAVVDLFSFTVPLVCTQRLVAIFYHAYEGYEGYERRLSFVNLQNILHYKI